MAEEEGSHRRLLEKSIVDAQIQENRSEFAEAKRGQICAVVIAVACLAVGAYTTVAGHDVAGSIIGVGGIGSIVTTFIVGRSQRQSQQSKDMSEPTRKAAAKKHKSAN